MARDGGVRAYWTGSDELARAFRSAARALPDEAREITEDAAEALVLWTRAKIPLGPARNGHVKYTLKATTEGPFIAVEGGDSAHSYFGWLEFGGRVGVNNSVYREVRREGRYIYPTLARRKGDIESLMLDGLDDLMRRHGITVT